MKRKIDAEKILDKNNRVLEDLGKACDYVLHNFKLKFKNNFY